MNQSMVSYLDKIRGESNSLGLMAADLLAEAMVRSISTRSKLNKHASISNIWWYFEPTQMVSLFCSWFCPDKGKQQLGKLANHSLQSKCNMENAKISDAIAMVEGAYNSEQRSEKEEE